MLRDILQLRGSECVSMLDRRKPASANSSGVTIILPATHAGLLHSFAKGFDEDRARIVQNGRYN
jgi:hypothetical protein